MEQNENLDSVMKRIAKLLAIASDSRANENEAMSAAMMAKRLMDKYQLDNKDEIMSKLKKGEDMTKYSSSVSSTLPNWMKIILSAVGVLFEVRVTLLDVPRIKQMFISGFTQDVEIAQYTLNYLIKTVDNMGNTAYPRGSGTRDRNDYKVGVSIRIYQRIKDYVAAMKEQESVDNRGLVLLKKDAIDKHFGEVNSLKSKKVSARNSNASVRGYADGNDVDFLRRGVGTNKSDSLLIA